ncbi:hypothetical protein BGZ61DRAFT_536453 [Ilyonectria robusta]|uniref:uncharacterized protein n=1 Tax=Ilyonectria robusta TaxID=1079257 RepID=UPI001E8CECE5|nr:uncharacterized protein BGZ61DRAFT_536453 [Ilyonectria robusta]KAH8675173.1 hypothetical protein BGZ61DRAFT_536453 [Ilyonectria robusta]
MRPSNIFASALTLAMRFWASLDGSIQKRFAGGWCGVHVHGHRKLDSETRSGWIKIYDVNGYLVFQNNEVWQDQGSILIEAQEGGMPDKMYATIFPSGNPSSGDVAEFRYGDRAWRSGGANSEYFEGDLLICKVGNWNTGAGLVPSYGEIDLDCSFTC